MRTEATCLAALLCVPAACALIADAAVSANLVDFLADCSANQISPESCGPPATWAICKRPAASIFGSQQAPQNFPENAA